MATRHVTALLCLLASLLHNSQAEWHTSCKNLDCRQTVGSRSLPCTVIKQTTIDGKCSGTIPKKYHGGNHILPPLSKDDIEINNTSDHFRNYGEFPGMNVSIAVPLTTGSQKVTGIQIILRGKNNNHDYQYTYYDQEICRILDLNDADMTHRTGDPEKVTFSYDCLRPLSPESIYEVEVNLLPFPHSGQKRSVIISDVRTHSCNSKKASDLHECFIQMDKYKAVHWGPTIFDVNFTHDRNVSVDFNLPNDNYELDQFRLFLYKENGDLVRHKDIIPGQDDIYVVAASDGKMYSAIHFTPFTNVDDGKYFIKLRPIPTKEGVCKSVYDGTEDCKVTVSETFTVRGTTNSDDKKNNKKKDKTKKDRRRNRPEGGERKGRRKDRQKGKNKKNRRREQ